MFECNICDKIYQHKTGLNKHLRQKHNLALTKKFQCSLCSDILNNKTKLIAHLKAHKIKKQQKDKLKRLACPFNDCELRCINYSSLHNHLKLEHSCILEERSLEFETNFEFEKWKNGMEQSSNSMYVRDTGMKLLKNGKRRCYYICHRSYNERLQKETKRNMKKTGSNKIGTACPSILIFTECGNKCLVKFFPTHVGHDCEIERMKISKDERNVIAGKLAKGETVESVLDNIKESARSSELKRIHLLKKKDINNIKRIVTKISENCENCSLQCLKCNNCLHSSKCSCNENIEPNYIYHREEIQAKLNLLLELNQVVCLDENNFLKISKCLDRVLQDMSNDERLEITTDEINRNVDIKKQDEQNQFKLDLVKRECTVENITDVTIPLHYETQNNDEASNQQNDILNIHSGFDHTYYLLSK